MKNAHLRFGTMDFHRSVGNSVSRFSLRMDRFIGERVADDIAKAHFVSVVGGDAQIAAVSAIASDQQNFAVDGPGLPPMHVNLGKNAQCYRASVQLSTSKRPLRHLIAVSEEFGSASNSETSGRTLLAESSAAFLWAAVTQVFGLPAIPEWADWFYKKLDDNLAVSPIYGLGFRPVLVTGTKAEFLQWLSDGIQKNEIRFPESNGPAVWPLIGLERVLTPPAGPSVEANETAE
jgi:hypothetical protein